MHKIMTKCHLILLMTVAVTAASCGGHRGPSLSEYGSQNSEYRAMMFEKYALQLLSESPERALARQDSTMRSVSQDSAAFFQMVELQDHFFKDPNSPYRCEDFCLPVLYAIVESPFTPDSARFAAKADIANFSLNRIGTTATDFSFTLKGGRTRTLHSVEAEWTLLFFSNPGCTLCRQITEELSSIPGMEKMVEEGYLSIVNIYPDDDVEAWYGYLAEYPPYWISGYAPEVDGPQGPYFLRAIPTLYLLDRDKRVLLKDAPLERILAELNIFAE